MNKKFSTLVATLLLSGALISVNATDVKTLADFKADAKTHQVANIGDNKIVFLADIALDETTPYLLIDQNNLVIDGNDKTFTGHLVITGENVTVKNLTIVHNGGGETFTKSAISVFASSVAITGNTIKCKGTETYLANGIILFPTKTKVNYLVQGNTIENASNVVDKWQSFGIKVAENGQSTSSLEGFTSSEAIEDFDVTTISNNTYVNCAIDYLYKNDGVNTDKGSSSYKAAQVTPIKNKEGEYLNKSYIKSIVTSATETSNMVFNGSSTDLKKALEGETVASANVAIVCSDVNVLYGDAENPDNGKTSVINNISPAVKSIDNYQLITNPGTTSEYAMIILTNNNGKANWIISADGDGKAVVADLATVNLVDCATQPAYLWKMTSGKDADGSVWYKFENQEGTKLVSTVAAGSGTGQNGIFNPEKNIPYSENGVYFKVDGNNLNTANNTYSWGLYTAGYNKLSVEDLKWFEKDGFSVTIKYKNDKGEFKKEDIAGNPFAGHLALMNWNGSKFVEAESESTDNLDYDFYLMNADGNFIVAEKYIFNGASKDQEAYTFTTVTAKALAHDIIANKDKREYYGEFQAEVSAKYKQDTYHGLKVIDLLSVKIGNGWAPVGRLDLGTKEVPTLAASIDTKLFDIQVNLGSNKVVDPQKFVQAKFFTVTKLGKDGGMLAVAGDKYEGADYYDCEFVSACGNDLEKQFALTYRSGDGKFVFTNRETLNYRWTIDANRLYYGEKDNEYVYGGDTYLIETVENHEAKDGYSQLSDVKNTKFHIAYSSGIFGNAWFTENHQGVDNHTIGLSTDKETALVFTATEYAKERAIKHDEDAHTNKYVPTDSIYVISKLGFYDKDAKKFDSKDDTLKVVSYSFVNQYGEPLIWNGNRYVSSTEKSVAADKFALRKDNGKLNLRPVVGEWDSQGKHYTSWISAGDNESYLTHQYFGTTNKAYAGDADEEGILSQTWMYNRTENDLFTVEPTEKPMYRTVINPLDTISIFRNDNPKSILFEDKGFLGMENLAQYPFIAPAMVADTAYVRDNTYRPQYMLVVNPDITPAGMWCEEHQSATCEHAVPTKGWVEGRYLVNLVDTAIVWDIANKHKDNNPYINTEKFYRLGFVQAKHIEDSLIIASTNDTLMVGTEDYNQAKFAFRYVDTDAKSFRIETANYKRLPGVKEAEVNEENELGYVKWMNGVVVVVDKIEDGDVFNMNEDEQGDPTANDAIATGGVSVIATEGAVIVKGAEGKNVVITNVLGQTIANTVITSSEAQISAPAGIVVVAVEGEAAVKAIVK